jgi:hypothetical protein
MGMNSLVLLSTRWCVNFVIGHIQTMTDPFQLPEIKPYPQESSILILDNLAIHKSDILREIVESQSMLCYC